MGYDSCAHCFKKKSFHKNNRSLFKVSKPFILREKNKFQACGELAEKRRIAVNGVKSITPLSKFFNLPWDCVIDPMHQICLGTANVLSKFLISLAKGGTLKEQENLVSNCKIPFDILIRTKKLKDLTFWKAFDFKLFFFHIGPLVFDNLNVSNIYFESFCKLSFAIRLLSDGSFDVEYLQPADALISSFFENFLDLYGLESQSFNFHTMRHLVEQVRRNGPLWLFSAFCFESANHQLLSALSGTIKNPEKMVDRFLKHQNSLDELDIITSVKVSCIESFTKLAGELKI